VPLRRSNPDIICKRYLITIVEFKYSVGNVLYFGGVLGNEGHPYRKDGGARKTTDYLRAMIFCMKWWRELSLIIRISRA
jgi:hypothetical protein